MSTKIQIRNLQIKTSRLGAIASTETDLGPSRQTWCIGEHKKGWDPPDRLSRRGALASTETDLDPPGRHSRRGALASTETDLGPPRTDVVH